MTANWMQDRVVSRNTTQRDMAVCVPRGTRIYEGEARGIQPVGAVGGGNQLVLVRVRSEWVVTP